MKDNIKGWNTNFCQLPLNCSLLRVNQSEAPWRLSNVLLPSAAAAVDTVAHHTEKACRYCAMLIPGLLIPY